MILFVLDKLIRLFFIFLLVSPKFLEGCGILIVILLQSEELLSFFYRNQHMNEDDDFFYHDDVILSKEFTYKSEFINIPMIPQLIFISFWLFNINNETYFLLGIPCFFFLFFYLNNIWSRLMTFQNLNYAEMIIEYISIFSYLGLVLICQEISNFIIYFVILSITLSIIMSYRYLTRFEDISLVQKIILMILILILVISNSGVQLRRLDYFNKEGGIQVSNLSLDYFIIQKFIQNNFLFLFLILNYSQIPSRFSEQLIVIVLISSLVYFLINIYEIWTYLVKDKLKNKRNIQIESYDELVRYNDLNMKERINTNIISSVVFLSTTKYNMIKDQQYLYCLLFNFEHIELTIPPIGNRYLVDSKMTVNLFSLINPQFIMQILIKQELCYDIQKIEFQLFISHVSLLKIIKAFSENKLRVPIIYSKNIPNNYLKVQEEFISQQLECILRNIVFFEITAKYLNQNPYATFADLYEDQIDSFIF